MIDTHCHLTDPRLFNQLDEVLQRARSAGVSRFVTIGTHLDDDAAAIDLCRGRDDIRCAVGIHPNYVEEADIERVGFLKQLGIDPAVVAIGEMGLDYHYDRSPRDLQAKVFVRQMEIAQQLGKPVVIHCREAVDDTLAILSDFPQVPALFHCFTGILDEVKRIVAAGHMIGFTGPITYKKNDALREVVNAVPIGQLVVETDAPYLSPEPVRSQKTNEPAFVMHTARVAAQVKQMDLEAFDHQTTQNALRFFRWEV